MRSLKSEKKHKEYKNKIVEYLSLCWWFCSHFYGGYTIVCYKSSKKIIKNCRTSWYVSDYYNRYKPRKANLLKFCIWLIAKTVLLNIGKMPKNHFNFANLNLIFCWFLRAATFLPRNINFMVRTHLGMVVLKKLLTAIFDKK